MSDIEEEVRGFEAELDRALGQVKACVDRLRSAASDDLRFLIAERLPMLGSAAIPSLQDVWDDPESSRSVRYLAAWVAVEVGDRGEGIEILCAEVDAGTRWSLPAAGVLARHRLYEGAEPVAAALGRVDPQNSVEILGYATALRQLGGDLPASARLRILTESPEWVSRTVSDDFPTA